MTGSSRRSQSISEGSHGKKCTCGGDFESASDDGTHSHPSRRRHDLVCKECGRKYHKACSPFLVIFCILNLILIILGAGLAFAAIYTSRLGDSNIEDLRTYEYEYHLKRLMYCIAGGGILAAITGVVGLVVLNPRVGNTAMRVIYETMLLLVAALLLVLGALGLGAILIRKNVFDEHFRPIMTAYQHEEPPNPFLNLHRFQAEFRCCGLSKPPDPYVHLQGNPKGPLPWSCCTTFTSNILKDPVKVNNTVKEAQNKTCSRDVPEYHKTYCDRINRGLADWAFGSAIEALGVSIFCIILLIISCAARHIRIHPDNRNF